MKILLIAILISAFALICQTSAQTLQTNIANGNGERNKLDLYLPDRVSNPPIVLFIHGGRWFRNDKEQVKLYDRVKLLNQAGIAVASMNYTFSTTAIWPAQKDDVLTALRFLSGHGSKLGYDPARMAVWGQSSGAHLALWAGLLATENDELEVRALVSWYAPSNLFELSEDRLNDKVPDSKRRVRKPSPESKLIGMSVPENRAATDAASPEHYFSVLPAGTKLPATPLLHGDQDHVVSPLQSRRLYDTTIARNSEAEIKLRFVEGAKHGGKAFEAVVPEVIEFLNHHLGPVAKPSHNSTI